MLLQEISLTANTSLVKTLNHTFNDCDNTTELDDCTKPASFLRHPVGALATFAHVYTAPGRYWVTVWAHGVVPGTHQSETVTSNISVVVITRPTLIDDTGLVFLVVSRSTYVDEPLRLIILVQNLAPDVDVTVDCDDNAGTSSLNVVETSTKITLRELIDSNRYRIAARSALDSANIDEMTTMYSRLDVVHTFHQTGERRIAVTFSRFDHEDRFTLSTVVAVLQRPTLADKVGTVMIMSRKPAYVDEPVEFLYAVQRPNAELEYRLDFGDGLHWSFVSANSTIHLPGWVNVSDPEWQDQFCELISVSEPTPSLKWRIRGTTDTATVAAATAPTVSAKSAMCLSIHELNTRHNYCPATGCGDQLQRKLHSVFNMLDFARLSVFVFYAFGPGVK